MEDPTTPWWIAEATASAGVSEAWVWLTLVLGAVAVLAGGILIALM